MRHGREDEPKPRKADGRVNGENLICGVHNWDYRLDTGVSEYNNAEVLPKFRAWVESDDDAVYVDESEIRAWHDVHPQSFDLEAYLGLYADRSGTCWTPLSYASPDSRPSSFRN